jgi:hypothetical protein
VKERTEKILDYCGFKLRETRSSNIKDDDSQDENMSKALVYTTYEAVQEMATLLQNDDRKTNAQLAAEFSKLIAQRTAMPDMALSGRMLEPGESANKVWERLDTTIEAAFQVAHAISTHEARPEVDYYVAKDDIPGDDAWAGYLDEAMFASACFYKYFSIHWETLVNNLKGYGEKHEELAAHTVGAFIRGAVLVSPTGMQNRFAAHNLPDGILIEIKNTPTSYANAFARPAAQGERDIISQSIAQLGQYVHDLDAGYGKPQHRFWFSPNLRYALCAMDGKQEIALAENNIKSLEELVPAVIKAIGHDWGAVQKVVLNAGATS